MKLLITGATGFVGRSLIPHLLKKNTDSIAILVRNIGKAQSLFKGLDIQIIDSLNQNCHNDITVYNPDAVIHLATFFTGKCDKESATSIINSNILFPSLLLETLTKTDCQYFINIGTFSEFLNNDEVFFANNLYSASKTALRPIIKYYQTQSHWKWINIILYSPYGRYNENKKIIDHLYSALGSPIPVDFTEGIQTLDFIHVDDIASFFSKLLANMDIINTDYTQLHLGTGNGHTLREVAEIMERVSGKKINANWGGIPYKPLDIMYAVAPLQQNVIQWRPEISLEEGLKIYLQDVK